MDGNIITDIYDVYHCEEDPLSIDCGESHNWIQIIQAHYGRVSYPGERTCGLSNYQNFWEDKVSRNNSVKKA